ncbi:hypothetical protein D3C79_901680 [compost metagenome]
MEDLDAVDGTGNTLGFDPVAEAEWTEQQDQHATGKVGQAALQRQTDGQARGTNGSNKRGGFDADHRGYADHQQNLQNDVRQAADKALQGQVGVAQGEQFAQPVGHLVDHPPANGKGQQCQQQAAAIFHDQGNPGLRRFNQLIDFSTQIHNVLLMPKQKL